MSKQTMNLQDSFLNQVRKDNVEVKVALVDGTVLYGVIKGFDNFTIILNSQNSNHLIYKHAISQMVHRRGPVRKSSAAAPQPQSPKREKFNSLDFSNVKAEAAE